MAVVGYDENGKPVTQEDVNGVLDCVERGDFSEFVDVGACAYGSISPISEEKATVSFQLPVSTIDQINALAQKQNCSKSDVLRAFTFDGLLRTETA